MTETLHLEKPLQLPLCAAGVDHSVIVWDVASGTAVAHLTAHTDVVYALCFSRDGTLLASGETGKDPKIFRWTES